MQTYLTKLKNSLLIMCLNLRTYNRASIAGSIIALLMACSSPQTVVAQAKAAGRIQPEKFKQSMTMNKKETVEITTFRGHSERVASVAFSPDSQLIASASYDNTVKLWNPRSNQIVRVFSVEKAYQHDPIEDKSWIDSSSRLSFSQDGKFLALGDGYNTLISWEVGTGKVIKKVKRRDSYTAATAFSNDGRLFANLIKPFSSNLGSIVIWDVATGQQINSLDKSDLVHAIAFSNDNRFLISATVTSKIQLWDLSSKKVSYEWQGIRTAAISPNGEFVAIDNVGVVKVWNRKTGAVVYSLIGDRDFVQALVFSSDSQSLAIASTATDTITIWDLKTGRKIKTLSSPELFSIAISSDGELIASGNFDKTVKVWRMIHSK